MSVFGLDVILEPEVDDAHHRAHIDSQLHADDLTTITQAEVVDDVSHASEHVADRLALLAVDEHPLEVERLLDLHGPDGMPPVGSSSGRCSTSLTAETARRRGSDDGED